MTNEELLQGILNASIQRFGKQASAYELEIANLNGQVIALTEKIREFTENSNIENDN